MTATDASPPAQPPQAPTRLRLDFLDGLRGLTALYVVLFHCWDFLRHSAPLPLAAHRAIAWMGFGRSAVTVFIVISGYVLMLPVARAEGGRLRGGLPDFFRRRARRILPPYYAALALAVLVVAAGKFLHKPVVFTWGAFWSHVLLLHNLRDEWLYALNVPMWSVAVEWQIYFVFALLLLPLWRHFGALAALAAAFGLGLAPHYLFHWGDLWCPWYLGLFALGMAGAVLSTDERRRGVRDAVPWGALAAGFSLAYVGLMAWRLLAHHDAFAWMYFWQVDALVGLAAISFILYGAHAPGRPWAVALLDRGPIFGLGLFSYSVYLVHDPVFTICHSLFNARHLSALAMLAAMLLVAIPVALGFAYLFHLAFERPFLSGHQSVKIKPS